ncbi:transcriptional regulator, ArsR family [Salinimicrobium catena]|uniref:Transcriptional regulator, ArsR family n=1 Tax=Salinimicrobium catena TaxID=390640 RepID=A0A1H5MZ40_9FLAO|nr:metalloregulator ArsR/SmtB family transcription factor [Salinimicrobium catena]SDL32901.1 DNA-binding transcriptional regulator, ArsR family [Salinimicrobium catena]SEE94526.1 transcriptional regulator, ArsR family [Salinimicrobium catena]
MGITKKDLFTSQQNELASLAKAFAHPARIAIIDYLLKSETCINGDLVQELGLAQATISQHLRELRDAGILKGSIEGSSICYCLDPTRWKEVESQFNNLFSRLSEPAKGDCC